MKFNKLYILLMALTLIFVGCSDDDELVVDADSIPMDSNDFIGSTFILSDMAWYEGLECSGEAQTGLCMTDGIDGEVTMDSCPTEVCYVKACEFCISEGDGDRDHDDECEFDFTVLTQTECESGEDGGNWILQRGNCVD